MVPISFALRLLGAEREERPLFGFLRHVQETQAKLGLERSQPRPRHQFLGFNHCHAATCKEIRSSSSKEVRESQSELHRNHPTITVTTAISQA